MEAFIGTVMMWPCNFAPRGWMFCQGQLLSIAQNTALFSLLGTSYGGDGMTTFALPNLSGRVAIGVGSNKVLGETGGTDAVTLTSANLPAHNHVANITDLTVQVSSSNSTIGTPSEGARISAPGTVNGREFSGTLGFDTSGSSNVKLASDSISGGNVNIGLTGGNQPFNILQPYISLNFIICTEGIFPSRP